MAQARSSTRRSRAPRVLAVALAAVAPAVALPLGASAATVPQTSVVSGAPSAATPHVHDGHVEEIVSVGNRTLLGGDFTSASSAGSRTAVARRALLSFDAAGAVDPAFAPVLDGPVNALLAGPVPDSAYVGGAFVTLGGANVPRLLLLDTRTGAPVPGFRAPAFNGAVNDVKRVGDRLYVGGNFTKVGGVAHAGLVTLSARTGALDPYLGLQVAGHHNWTPSSPSTDAKGAVGVRKLDVDPAGTRLVAIGNFKTVSGADLDQVAVVDLTGPAARLADWHTDRYDSRCAAGAFDSWVRDVDFAPDGSYFVVVTTGGYPTRDVLCDAAARWETAATGSRLQPTWVDWTGGDTLLSVAVTEAAVYVGGHQRWLNNPLGRDYAGPGAVPRPGLGALDPRTGLPLAWNPGRNPRGVGAAALHVAPEGLYVGSDTDGIGVGEAKVVRRKIALFPLAGGQPRAADATPALPGTIVAAQQQVRTRVLHRVNAGGPAVAALDGGPAWSADEGSAATAIRVAGSSTTAYAPISGDRVPKGVPSALYDSERWDPRGGEELTYRLPVPTATPLTVRLHFANRCACTSRKGSRRFDVLLDGRRVLSRYDVVAEVGDGRGTYEELSVPSEPDGTVDLVLAHVTGDPMISAIEVLDASPASAVPPVLTARTFDGTSATSPVAGPVPGLDPADLRGAFVAGGALYYGSAADGALHRRALGHSSAVRLDPYLDPLWKDVANGSGGTYAGALPDLYRSIGSVTAMAYADGHLYYTLAGDAALRVRPFSTDSGVLGAVGAVADSSRDWSATTGLVLAGGRLYVAQGGNLYAVGWAGGRPTGALELVSATGDWGGRAMWLAPSE